MNETKAGDPATEPNKPERAVRRNRVLKEAFASWNGLFSSISCQVRDMSETGARVRLADSTILPDQFFLLIPIDGKEWPCEIRWRKPGEVGVSFIGMPRISSLHRSQVLNAYRADDTDAFARLAAERLAKQGNSTSEPMLKPRSAQPSFGHRR